MTVPAVGYEPVLGIPLKGTIETAWFVAVKLLKRKRERGVARDSSLLIRQPKWGGFRANQGSLSVQMRDDSIPFPPGVYWGLDRMQFITPPAIPSVQSGNRSQGH